MAIVQVVSPNSLIRCLYSFWSEPWGLSMEASVNSMWNRCKYWWLSWGSVCAEVLCCLLMTTVFNYRWNIQVLVIRNWVHYGPQSLGVERSIEKRGRLLKVLLDICLFSSCCLRVGSRYTYPDAKTKWVHRHRENSGTWIKGLGWWCLSLWIWGFLAGDKQYSEKQAISTDFCGWWK